MRELRRDPTQHLGERSSQHSELPRRPLQILELAIQRGEALVDGLQLLVDRLDATIDFVQLSDHRFEPPMNDVEAAIERPKSTPQRPDAAVLSVSHHRAQR
jgi:hypothetical protein